MKSCPPIIKIKRGAFVPLRETLKDIYIFFISFKENSRLNEHLSVWVHGVVGVCVYVWLIHGMTKLAF